PPFDPQTIVSAFWPDLTLLLSTVINRTMILELNVARLQGRLHGKTPREYLQDFLQQTRQKQALQALLEEYPVLARQIMTTINRWLNDSLEFLHRLCSDWQQICTTFSPERDPGLLLEVQGAEAGEAHHGARSALKLRFSSGLQLLYRPEPLDIDVHFQAMLLWLNEQGYHPAFPTSRLLPREGYGWSAFAQAPECTTRAEVEHFYERQGGYLALLYALYATNVRSEHLIASGEHPTLENLFYVRPKDVIDLDAAMNVLHFTVMRVGILPMQIFLKHGQHSPPSGTPSGHGGQQAGAETASLHLAREQPAQPDRIVQPKLHGSEVDPLEYQHCLVAGFTRMYRLLLNQREAFIEVPLARFASDALRCSIRSTHFYRHLLNESFHPDLLRDALERERHFDYLWQAVKVQPDLARLVGFERSDLLAGDIPRFTTRPGTLDIFSSRADCIADFLTQSGRGTAQQM